ncbi:MAG: hypothetical protein AAF481_13205 [Acidobacteriota bacterium]
MIRFSTIAAGSVVVKVSGNGEVEIVDSVIEAGVAALHLTGNAAVRATESTFVGDRHRSGNATFVDLGGNVFERSAN